MGTQVKDTALAAMKRAARAVLKEELKELRRDLKEARAVTTECTMKLNENNRQRHELQRQLEDERTRNHAFRVRASKVIEWGEQNRKGDLGFKCCAEYMLAGPSPLTYGAGGLYVNPFDRWQVTPALR